MPVSSEKIEELHRRMNRLQLSESDLIEKFILGSGKGGQKINKTSSCVYLKHLPSGIEIKCQKERSRELNRYLARRELCEKIERLQRDEKTKKEQQAEKIRRQKKRRTRKTQQKLLQQKRERSSIKSKRRLPSEEQE